MDAYNSYMNSINNITLTVYTTKCLLCENKVMSKTDINVGVFLCDECINRLKANRPDNYHTRDRYSLLYTLFNNMLVNIKNTRDRYLYIVFMCNKLRQLHIIKDFNVDTMYNEFKVIIEVNNYTLPVVEFNFELSLENKQDYIGDLSKTKEPDIIPKEMFEL